MTGPVLSRKLQELVDYLDSLTARASVEELDRRLRTLNIAVDDVRDYVQFNEANYRRNLIRGGEWYDLLVLCWRSGQRSPIHNHAESTCGLKVLKGVATETKFEMTPSMLIKAVLSIDQHEGEICANQDADMHQISNLQAPGRDLITMHIYTPPLRKMKTFSLTERSVGVYIPEIIEYSFGSGI